MASRATRSCEPKQDAPPGRRAFQDRVCPQCQGEGKVTKQRTEAWCNGLCMAHARKQGLRSPTKNRKRVSKRKPSQRQSHRDAEGQKGPAVAARKRANRNLPVRQCCSGRRAHAGERLEVPKKRGLQCSQQPSSIPLKPIDRVIRAGLVGIFKGSAPLFRVPAREKAPANQFVPRCPAGRKPDGYISEAEHYAFAAEIADMPFEELMAH